MLAPPRGLHELCSDLHSGFFCNSGSTFDVSRFELSAALKDSRTVTETATPGGGRVNRCACVSDESNRDARYLLPDLPRGLRHCLVECDFWHSIARDEVDIPSCLGAKGVVSPRLEEKGWFPEEVCCDFNLFVSSNSISRR